MELSRFYQLSQQTSAYNLEWTHEKTPVQVPPQYRSLKPSSLPMMWSHSQVNSHATIILTGSAEAYAVTTGLLTKHTHGTALLPARLHTGPKRSIDLQTATYQALQIPVITDDLQLATDSNVLVVDLLREGPQTKVQDALYWLMGLQPINVLFSISHAADDSTPLGRKAVVQQPNLEGVVIQDVSTVILSDPIAGGVTQFFALEYLMSTFPNLQKVIIVSPHLAAFGGLALCAYAQEINLQLSIIGFGALLESIPPEMYFSPTPVHKSEWFVDPRHIQLMRFIYGEAADKLCVAGNWTAMFLAPSLGIEWYENELKEVGLNLEQVATKQPTKQQLMKWGFDEQELLPISSLIPRT